MLQQVRTLVDIMKNDAVSQRGVTIETQCWLLVPNMHDILPHIWLCSALISTTTGK